MPAKSLKALSFAFLVWVVGFIWGSIVFMTPALKNVAGIPYVSKNPAISFPLLIIFPVLIYLLAKNYLKDLPDPEAEGLKLGVTFAVVNFVLDLVVLVVLLKAGFSYFVSLTVWVAYLMLLVSPWLVGRSRPDR